MALTVVDIEAKFRSSGADKVKADARDIGSEVNKLEQTGKKLTAVGAGLTAGLAVPLGVVGLKAIDAASDTNEALSAAGRVYGDYSNQVITASEEAAQAVGMSQQEYLAGATNLAVYGKMAGLAGDDLVQFGADGLTAAADLASFYNAPVPEALDAIRAGLIGETEPLRRFGILLNNDTVEAKAFAMGLQDANGEISEGAKVAARHALIMEQMGDASGDFLLTSDGLANSQRILGAAVKDLSAEFGQALLPAAQAAVGVMMKLVEFFSNLPAPIKTAIAAVAALAAALGPILAAVGAAMLGLSQLAPLFSKLGSALGPLARLFMSPIASIARLGAALLALHPAVLVAAAAAGLLFAAYKTNFLGFGDLVDGAVQKAREVGDAFGAAFDKSKAGGSSDLVATIEGIGGALSEITGLDLSGPFDAIGDGVTKMENAFRKGIKNGLNPLDAGIRAIGKYGADTIRDLSNEMMPIVSELFGPEAANQFGEWGEAAADAFQSVVDGAGRFGDAFARGGITEALNTLPQTAQEVWGNLKNFGTQMLDFGEEVLSNLVGPEVAKNVTDALRGVGDAYGAGVEWIWGTALPKIKEGAETALNAFKGALEPVGEWITGTAMPAIGDAAGQFFDFLGESFQQFGDTLGPQITETLGNVFDTVGTTLARAGEAIEQINWAGIGEGIGNAFDTIGSTLARAGEAIESLDIQGKLQALADAIGPIFDAIGSAVEGFDLGGKLNAGLGALMGLAEGVGNALGSLKDAIGPAFEAIGQAVEGFDLGGKLNAGLGALMGLAEGVGTALGSLKDSIGPALESIGQAVEGFDLGGKLSAGLGALMGIAEGAATALGSLKDAVQPALDGIKTALEGFDLGDTLQAGLGALMGVVEGAGNALNNLKGAIGPALEGIKSALEGFDIQGDTLSKGLGSLMGVAEGALNALQGLGDNIGAALEGVKSALEGFDLGDSLQKGLGALMGIAEGALGAVQGLADGIGGALDTVVSTLEGIDLGPALESSFSLLQAAASGVAGAITKAQEALSGIGGAIAAMDFSGLTAVVDAFQPVLDILNSVVSKAGEVAGSLGEAIGGVGHFLGNVGPLGDEAAPQGGQAAPPDTAALEAASAAMTALQEAVMLAQTTITTAITAINTSFSTLDTAAATAATNVATNFGTMSGTLSGLITGNLSTGLTTLGTAFTTLATTASTAFTNLATAAGTAVGTLSGLITGNLTTALTTAGTAFTTLETTAVTAVQNMATEVTTAFTTLATEATTAGTTVGENFTSGLTTGFAGAVGAVQAALDSIRGVLSGFSLYAEGITIGSSLGEGIVAGINSMAGAVSAAAGALVDVARGAAAAMGEIFSPSRLMRREIGRPLGEGVVAGLEDLMPRVKEAAAALVSAALTKTQGTNDAVLNTPAAQGSRALNPSLSDEEWAAWYKNKLAHAADKVMVGGMEYTVEEFNKLADAQREKLVKAAGGMSGVTLPEGATMYEDQSIGFNMPSGGQSKELSSLASGLGSDLTPLMGQAVTELKTLSAASLRPDAQIQELRDTIREMVDSLRTAPDIAQPIQLMLDRQTLLDEILVPITRSLPRSKSSEGF